MRIVVTGSDGFIGQNLTFRLAEAGYADVTAITRSTDPRERHRAIASADFIFHLAGINRPRKEQEFSIGNETLTSDVCAAASSSGRAIPILFTSSTQAAFENPYGRSKLAAEEALKTYRDQTGSPIYIFRLTNVFGKWCRPFYNSAVATFCHQITRGLELTINDPKAKLRLLFIDDVIGAFVGLLAQQTAATVAGEIQPVYETTVGEVVSILQGFRDSRQSLLSPPVGTGLVRALYSTYVSYLPPESFSYQVPAYRDPRGEFVEMLKTPTFGQFSYFTALPGVTRGEHYHHTKTEKFLIITGEAQFGFRHLRTGERYELCVSGGEGRIVETAPGWVHKITNVGEGLLVVMLWVNEIFDRAMPDTTAVKVEP